MRKKIAVILGVCVLLSGCGQKSGVSSNIQINRETSSLILEEENTSEVTTELETETTELKTTVEITSEAVIETDEFTTEYKKEITMEFVKEIISTLLSSTSQESIDTYLSTIDTTEGFEFQSVVNKDTRVSIESIGVNVSNESEYLAIVTLRQDGGISKFSVTVTFEGGKLSSFDITKF